MKKRELDLEALDAVSGGINLRTLQTHMGDSHAAPVMGGDPFHAGPQFSTFGTHPAVPGAFPSALHPVTALPQVPHAPTPAPVAHAPAPAASQSFNPASAIQSITGLIGAFSKLGGGGSSNSGGGARGQSGSSGSGSSGSSGSGFGQSFGDFERAGQSGTSTPGHSPSAADPYASRELNQFTQQDSQNRANGYYGAFGDAPTGPSGSQLNQFTQQDNQNRANGYYGAFGDAPTGPSQQQQLDQFTQQDQQNRDNGYYGAFGDAPTGPSQQQQLDQFTQQDQQNRDNGYYGAFGDAPTAQQAPAPNESYEPTPNADGSFDI